MEDRAAALHAQLDEMVSELVSGEDWAAMLATSAKFHRYSLGNVLLIVRQCPTATRVAGFKRWQELGRQVRKGEKGIAILAPCVRKIDDGEGGEVRRLVGFKVAHVFDVAQTDGEPLADVRPVLLEGEAPEGLWDGLAKQVADAGFMLGRGECGGANGRTDYISRTVTVRADVSDAQAVKTLAHELGHILCGHEVRGLGWCRGVAEVEAESVAFIVTSAHGLSSDGYTLPYVAGWAGGDAAVVKATAEKVIATARQILDELEMSESIAVAA